MGDFRRDNREGRRFGGRPSSFESRSRFNRDRNADRGRPQMHDAECSKCGKHCQVPFRPTGTKPVFCSECFRPEGDARPSFRPRTSERTGPQSNVSLDQLKQINAKLDKILLTLADLEMVGDNESEDVLESDDTESENSVESDASDDSEDSDESAN